VKTKENDILTFNNAYEDLKKDYDVKSILYLMFLEKTTRKK